MDFIAFKKWLFAGLLGVVAAAAVALQAHFGTAADAGFVADPTLAGIVGIVFGLIARALGAVVAKLGA